eukprot:g78324.t1
MVGAAIFEILNLVNKGQVPNIPPSPDCSVISNYYDPLSSLSGDSLKITLRALGTASVVYLTKDKRTHSFLNVWDAYENCAESSISSNCFPMDALCSDGCREEGDCFVEDVVFLKSWLNNSYGPNQGPNIDLHNYFPADGYIRSHEQSLPYGNVKKNDIDFQSKDGGVLTGACASMAAPDGSKCFEMKNYCVIQLSPDGIANVTSGWCCRGDLARAALYVLMQYSNTTLPLWQIQDLQTWHNKDPVDAAEKQKNDDIFSIQGNRNPIFHI